MTSGRSSAAIPAHEIRFRDLTFGYPNGLAGARIPIGARILLAAESYLAIAFGRSYHGQQRDGEPLEELRADSGTRYDPAVLDALAAVVPASPGVRAQTA